MAVGSAASTLQAVYGGVRLQEPFYRNTPSGGEVPTGFCLPTKAQ